jgi:dipeptidase E
MEKGTVLTGGSAGAICWFDAGHSDSADPETYLLAMTGENKDEASLAPKEGETAKGWKYIRAPCLGLLPGFVCPHHDKVQSNGILRATDFDQMLLRNSGERGICIDHFAALVVEGDDFSVLSLPGRPGSVLNQEFSAERKGVPGCW